jgi:antitoxin component HigA of HigAB toxin-antitoxin module
MTSSQEQYRERIGKNDPIPVRLKAYHKQRFQQKAFARLAKAFAERAEEFGLTKSGVSALIGRDKAQINRLLAHPSNMTFDTYSELALALNFEPTILLEDLNEEARHNYSHEAFLGYDNGLGQSFNWSTGPITDHSTSITFPKTASASDGASNVRKVA